MSVTPQPVHPNWFRQWQFKGKVKKPQRRPNTFGRPEDERPRIENLDPELPQVHISPRAHGKMWALVQLCDIEVGWLCVIRQSKIGEFTIDDIFVPHQVCTISTTTITQDGEAELLGELLQNNQREVINHLSGWGHSHVNFSVGASGTDELQTQSFVRRHMKRGSKYFLRVIANKKGDFGCSVYLLDRQVAIHNPPLHITSSESRKWRGWARAEIASRVKHEVFTLREYTANVGELEIAELNKRTLDEWYSLGGIDKALYRYLKNIIASNSAMKNGHSKNIHTQGGKW